MLSLEQKIKLLKLLKEHEDHVAVEKDGSAIYSLGRNDTIIAILATNSGDFRNMSDEEIVNVIDTTLRS